MSNGERGSNILYIYWEDTSYCVFLNGSVIEQKNKDIHATYAVCVCACMCACSHAHVHLRASSLKKKGRLARWTGWLLKKIICKWIRCRLVRCAISGKPLEKAGKVFHMSIEVWPRVKSAKHLSFILYLVSFLKSGLKNSVSKICDQIASLRLIQMQQLRFHATFAFLSSLNRIIMVVGWMYYKRYPISPAYFAVSHRSLASVALMMGQLQTDLNVNQVKSWPHFSFGDSCLPGAIHVLGSW